MSAHKSHKSKKKKHKKKGKSKKKKNETKYECEEEHYEEYEDDEDIQYYEEYGDDWDENYDNTQYAPPKKRKYRASDLSIEPLSYHEAKKQKSKQTRDKFEKRYSKYDSIIIDDNDDTYEHKIPKSKKYKNKNNRHRKNDSNISLSITNEINDQSVQSKEVSIFYNKKTKDKYDDFEMNTYSSDSTSDSDAIANKYLNNNKGDITPAPNDIEAGYKPSFNGYNKKRDNAYNESDETDDIKPKKQFKPSEQQKKKNKKKLTVATKITLSKFMNVDLKIFVTDNDYDNFDIAKTVCKYFDTLCGDTDTVTIVADSELGPNTAYWSKGDYNRVDKRCLGKYIMIYRACKHVQTTVTVKQDIFESCVKGLCMDNVGHSQLIADKLDCIFGEGCHVSLASHDQFEVFCRYSDGYICEVELPSGDFVVAWRR